MVVSNKEIHSGSQHRLRSLYKLRAFIEPKRAQCAVKIFASSCASLSGRPDFRHLNPLALTRVYFGFSPIPCQINRGFADSNLL